MGKMFALIQFNKENGEKYAAIETSWIHDFDENDFDPNSKDLVMAMWKTGENSKSVWQNFGDVTVTQTYDSSQCVPNKDEEKTANAKEKEEIGVKRREGPDPNDTRPVKKLKLANGNCLLRRNIFEIVSVTENEKQLEEHEANARANDSFNSEINKLKEDNRRLIAENENMKSEIENFRRGIVTVLEIKKSKKQVPKEKTNAAKTISKEHQVEIHPGSGVYLSQKQWRAVITRSFTAFGMVRNLLQSLLDEATLARSRVGVSRKLKSRGEELDPKIVNAVFAATQSKYPKATQQKMRSAINFTCSNIRFKIKKSSS